MESTAEPKGNAWPWHEGARWFAWSLCLQVIAVAVAGAWLGWAHLAGPEIVPQASTVVMLAVTLLLSLQLTRETWRRSRETLRAEVNQLSVNPTVAGRASFLLNSVARLIATSVTDTPWRRVLTCVIGITLGLWVGVGLAAGALVLTGWS